MQSLNTFQRRQRSLRLTSQVAGARMMAALARLERLLEKGGFNPDQPRVPAGNPDGGQWSGSGSGAASRQLSMGDNGGPPLDETDLATAAHVSNSTIRDYEAGHRVPMANNLAAIEAALRAQGIGLAGEGGSLSVTLSPRPTT